jgi:hypothetical protein
MFPAVPAVLEDCLTPNQYSPADHEDDTGKINSLAPWRDDEREMPALDAVTELYEVELPIPVIIDWPHDTLEL